MYVGDYLEESPLGKAEWLVVLSEIIGKRETGEKVFADIPVRYNVLKQKVADYTAGTKWEYFVLWSIRHMAIRGSCLR